MNAPGVRLLLKGQLVAEVPFRGPVLRIGRMKENEVVVNNLSVSRFHATLTREGDGFVLRDLGSENGCWVNGRRVSEAQVGPGDAIQIGKHELEIVGGASAAETDDAPVPRGRSDAWDAANTYLVGSDTRAKMLGHAAAEAPAPAPAGPAAATPAAPDAAVEPLDGEGAALFDDDASGGLGADDLAQFDVSELEVGAPDELEVAAAPGEAGGEPAEAGETILVGDDAPGEEEEATVLVGGAAASAEPAAAQPPAPETLHAGVIVQRGGRLERVVPLVGERLTLGRATECDVVLATAEVSRRHALLVREGARYEVRDLGSINGTFVNGQRVSRRALAVGDVVRIEDFELTFVLDREPLGDAVQPAAAAPAAAADADAGGLTQLVEVLDLAPFEAGEAGAAANAMSFETEAAPAEAEVVAAAAEQPAAVALGGAPAEAALDLGAGTEAEPPEELDLGAGVEAEPAETLDLGAEAEAAEALDLGAEPDAGEAIAPAGEPDAWSAVSFGVEAGGGEGISFDAETGAGEAVSFDGLDDEGLAPALPFEPEPEPDTLLMEDVAEASDEEKPLAPLPPGVAPTVRFELAVRVDELPPALREALAGLGEADLRLPVELRLARERSERS